MMKIPLSKEYTVSFNANGGTGAPSAQTKTYGQTLTLSSTVPTREGYTFLGWATSADGNVVYRVGDEVINLTINSDETINLYAVWQKD